MLRHLIACALLALAALPANTQERPAAEPKRGAYVVKHIGAKNLAGILARHFKGAAEIQAGPEGASNCLLISAPPAVFDEVMKTLEQLDRQPRPVAVEVFVVELPAKKADDKEAGLDEKEFSGALDDVAKNLEALRQKGQVAAVKHVQLTALEGQSASVNLGESKPYVIGSNISAAGRVMRSITYKNTGTQVRVTPQVADNTVTLDLNVQDSRMMIPEDGVVIGSDEKGNPVRAPEFPVTSLTSNVGVASGKAVLAKDTKTADKSGRGRILIVVGARVAGSEARAK